MVGERKKIGILFSYSDGWIGGTYYFLNLVSALASLPEEQKPHIIILANSEESFKKMKDTGYPYLSFLSTETNFSLTTKILNKIGRAVFDKNFIVKTYSKKELPCLYGYQGQIDRINCYKKVYWIPDLQEKFYPEYVGEKAAEILNKFHNRLAKQKETIVFSSQDSLNSFSNLFPDSNCQKHVLRFAVTLPDFSDLNIVEVKGKYAIATDYFISPNQFWRHKNHRIVIDAVNWLKQKGKKVTVVFTGNEQTNSGSYAVELKKKVSELELDDQVYFLGFIDRKEQLLLMKYAVAVIQPSFFEGWSTVVEDAKALGKFVLASNLEVHKEQLAGNVVFFDPNNSEDLANRIDNTMPTDTDSTFYEPNIMQFAKDFLKIFSGNGNS